MKFKDSFFQISTLILIGIVSTQSHLLAQGVGINDDGSQPDASAMLDVKSTTKGLLIPRMTTTERTTIILPATGLMVFDNTTLSFWYYDGTQWVEIGANGFNGSPFDTASATVIPNTALVDETTSDFVFGSTRLDDDGNTTHDSRLLFDKSKSAFRAGYVDGTKARANSWNTFSDRRWKKNFEIIPDALDKLAQVNGYYYDWKD